jgi:hypothetical protein
MTPLIFAICALISAVAVLTWTQYLHAKDCARELRKHHLSHYKHVTIYKGSDHD